MRWLTTITSVDVSALWLNGGDASDFPSPNSPVSVLPNGSFDQNFHGMTTRRRQTLEK